MCSKTIAIIQPVYLPWLGYFEQIARADHFVFYDDAQYTKQDWRNRNRIPGANGPVWLTVPVQKAPLGARINEIQIDNRHYWAKKQLRSVSFTYRRAPYFDRYFEMLEGILTQDWSLLADLDVALIQAICADMGITPEMSLSSQVPGDPGFITQVDASAADPVVARRNLRLVDLCRHHGADLFYVGARASDYIDTALFGQFGIKVVFQDYQHPSYPQPEPQSHMAVIDLLMNTGPDARDILLSSPAPGFAGSDTVR